MNRLICGGGRDQFEVNLLICIYTPRVPDALRNRNQTYHSPSAQHILAYLFKIKYLHGARTYDFYNLFHGRKRKLAIISLNALLKKVHCHLVCISMILFLLSLSSFFPVLDIIASLCVLGEEDSSI